MDINFWKMEGLGNDFIMMDDRDEAILNHISYSDLAIRLCDRHFGIGGDGIILARKSHTHDIRFVIINSDGTEPQMCGNGMRCFAKYCYETRILVQEEMRVETLAGTVIPKSRVDSDGNVSSVEVDMGQPELVPKNIPFVCSGEKAVAQPLETTEGTFDVTCVSMGNPHAVIFVDDLSRVNVKKTGRAVETHDRFPEKTNVEFIQVVSDTELNMKVWERGAGITLACGTGACASLVAAHLTGRSGDRAVVHLDGGDLTIRWDRETNHIFKTGPATLAFTGRVTV
ncbi:MAG TPA: diaminopimelate epimerase [Desulfobacteraceae bacterium]|nr:diaminopimelate epimerase [Desulfobacteraceae bacterium]|tara:strand:- start:2557 stop:3408 length:852 start_codon:yes stop_codon:yes gene_type:complete